ncbi:DinB family protein [Bacillus sp. USDA818B3_A]|uniref:DinB family protein n=1 Tax=Bacillus sp. USDA818B3_A TaxID=2698834 RepID=UPI001370836E|nr:DinB family protein [Bacillus sp. USDA818B3_A]
MFTSINEFSQEWSYEASSTQKVLDALTDESLQQAVSSDDRTLGRIAWHIVTSTPGMLNEFGVTIENVGDGNTTPASAKEVADTFRKVSADVANQVQKQWTDESLSEVQNVFGREMPRAASLSLLIKHIIHHRGQMTVLMRQAGLKVPGVYGPAREEWSQIGMEAPAL